MRPGSDYTSSVLAAVRRALEVPLFAKLSPNVTSLADIAGAALDEPGRFIAPRDSPVAHLQEPAGDEVPTTVIAETAGTALAEVRRRSGSRGSPVR